MEFATFKCSIKNLAFLEDNVYNFNGQIDKVNRIIDYLEGDISVKLKYDDNVEIVRDHNEYRIGMKFILNETTKGCYLLKENSSEIEFDLFTYTLSISETSITINYMINNDEKEKYEYNIEWSK